ncbi:universal stress protein [Hymenobacter nivis]|uniref:UspA domain-containing protein n=1 Tax=Hymenobacter nivis TaxID=1850093 RepID=A0A2Z3GJ24_9BACT|nr:universal stress protein [Hymenobacter nivis]AWM31717.1 hypothetical protein DDQ68_02290 [Hymenobacter nivis]
MASPLVVLTDFYAVTNHALAYAAGLAVSLKAELVLLHAHHDVLLAPIGLSPYSPISDYTTTQALQALAAEQPVPTHEVSERELPEAVRAAVHRHHPWLLVLGSPDGADTPVEIMTGTAMDLLTTVPYPLLMVPATG